MTRRSPYPRAGKLICHFLKTITLALFCGEIFPWGWHTVDNLISSVAHPPRIDVHRYKGVAVGGFGHISQSEQMKALAQISELKRLTLICLH